MDKLIQKSEAISLSEDDLAKIAGDQVKVLAYESLKGISTIDELLRPYGAVILLYQAEETIGHWVSLFMVDENTLEFFDSYGLKVDSEIIFSKYNHQPYLSELLSKSSYKLIQNTTKLQSEFDHVNTCGRYAAYRILHRHLPLATFVHLLTKNKYYNPDFWVSVATIHTSDHVYNIIED